MIQNNGSGHLSKKTAEISRKGEQKFVALSSFALSGLTAEQIDKLFSMH